MWFLFHLRTLVVFLVASQDPTGVLTAVGGGGLIKGRAGLPCFLVLRVGLPSWRLHRWEGWGSLSGCHVSWPALPTLLSFTRAHVCMISQLAYRTRRQQPLVSQQNVLIDILGKRRENSDHRVVTSEDPQSLHQMVPSERNTES